MKTAASGLQASHHDLTEDLEELDFLSEDIRNRCKTYLSDRSIRNLPSGAESAIRPLIGLLTENGDKRTNSVKRYRQLLSGAIANQQIRKIAALKHEIKDSLRTDYGLVAAAVTGANWQSPTFAASGHPREGLLRGKTEAAVSDYTRDNNRYVMDYEIAFRNRYIGQLRSLPAVCYATHSGMAAFATILLFLILEKKLHRTIIVGASTYFEAKEQLLRLPGIRVVVVPEDNTKAVTEAIRVHKPEAIFLDTVGNTPHMLVPDSKAIALAVRKYAPGSTFVIDNTCTSVTFDPMRYFPPLFTSQTVIVWESLNKFHQFGLDRTLGGIIWAWGKGVVRLFDCRGHLGTIMGDSQALSLPSPDRRLLLRRISRLTRNTSYLAEMLSVRLSGSKHVKDIVYPGLPSHPTKRHIPRGTTAGTFLMLDLPDRNRTGPHLLRLTRKAIREARLEGITIHAGTSFGLDVTRIYPTAIRSGSTRPFFRIAPGTETLSEIEEIGHVLSRVFI